MTKSDQNRTEWGVLIALFAVAFAIRAIGVDHGAILGDERINEAAKVLTGQVVPDQHFYPPLLNYLTAVVFGAMFAVGKFLGVWADPGAFRAQYFSDPTIFNVAGRLLVGALAALASPIGYWFARRLDYSRAESLTVAGFMMLAPISVYLSYIYKGDPALATFSLLSIAFFVRKIQVSQSAMMDVWLSLSMVVALSFKHSFIFLMAPLAVAYIVCCLPVLGFAGTIASVGRIFVTAVIAWPILNIGIVLDFDTFLEFQKVQSVMSITEGASFVDALNLLWQRMTHWQSGIGLILPVLFLGFPLVCIATKSPRPLFWAWIATVVGMLLVAYLVRLRQPEHLWVSFFVLMALFASLTLIEVTRLLKPLGVFIGSMAIGFALVGCIGIWQQTLAKPITLEVSETLEARYADRKVATAIPLPHVQQSREAQLYEIARHQRTADKYQVFLPPLSEERIVPEGVDGSQFVLPLPNPMFGLENAKDEDLIGNIQAYAWPPQQQDWLLDEWMADGIDVFVVSNLPYAMNETPSQMLRAFYQDLDERCVVAARFYPRKPLFLERETLILDCARAG